MRNKQYNQPKRQEHLLSVGEVVALLQKTDPKIRESKLRYWERQGLLSPERSAGGHRKYCPATVERLRWILELRGNKRLSIPMVQRILERVEEDPGYLLVVMEQSINEETFDPDYTPRSPQEAAAEANLTPAQLQRLEDLGVAVPCPGSGRYDWEAVELLKVAGRLLQKGWREDELAPYVNGAKKVVAHEQRLACRDVPENDADAAVAAMVALRQESLRLQRLLQVTHTRRGVRELEQFGCEATKTDREVDHDDDDFNR